MCTKNIFELSKLSGRISWKSSVGLWIFVQWWNQWVTRKFFFSFTLSSFLFFFSFSPESAFISLIESETRFIFSCMLIFSLPTSSFLFYFLTLYKSKYGSQVQLGWISSPLLSSWMIRSSVWNILTIKQRLLLVWPLFHNTYHSDGYTSEYRIHSQKLLL